MSPNIEAPQRRSALHWPILLALAAAVGICVWLVIATGRRLDAQDARLQALVSRLEAAGGGAASGTPPARARARAAASGQLPGALVSATPGSEAAGTDAAKAAEQAQMRRRSLATGFARQPRDADAGRLELGMLAAMDSPQLAATGLIPRDPDVACRRDMCRISASFRSESDAADWSIYYLTALTPGTAGRAEPAMTRNPDGSVHMALYAERIAAR